jgi:putative FmdB family regulatory protein
MPAYTYRCRNCDALDIEMIHSISEDPLVVCDDCGAARTRVPVGFGLSLKGEGWAGRTGRANVGSEKKPPARPIELGGTLNTGKK